MLLPNPRLVPNQAFHVNVDRDPDSAPHQGDANLLSLAYRPSVGLHLEPPRNYFERPQQILATFTKSISVTSTSDQNLDP